MKDDTLNTPEINSTVGIGNNNISAPTASQGVKSDAKVIEKGNNDKSA